MRRYGSAFLVVAAICLLGGTGGIAAERSAKKGKFTFGAVPQLAMSGKDFKAMQKAGMRSLRVMLAWSEVEPQPGAFNWAGFDHLVRTAARRNVRLLPYLYATPYWAARSDGYECTSDCSKYAPASEQTRGAFARFAAEAAARYGRGGHFWAAHPDLLYRPMRSWQIWNEQNSPKYFAPAPDVDSYAALLTTTSGAINAVDPKAEIVLGGMWGPRGAEELVPTASYLKGLYRREGVHGSFEALAVHPYAGRVGSVLDQIREVRRIARRSGDQRARMWVTELGWASKGPRRHYLVKSPRGQARILRQSYGALLDRSRRWRIKGAFWYAWQDTPSDSGFTCAWCPRAGLRAVGGGPKPAWRAMRSLAVHNRG